MIKSAADPPVSGTAGARGAAGRRGRAPVSQGRIAIGCKRGLERKRSIRLGRVRQRFVGKRAAYERQWLGPERLRRQRPCWLHAIEETCTTKRAEQACETAAVLRGARSRRSERARTSAQGGRRLLRVGLTGARPSEHAGL